MKRYVNFIESKKANEGVYLQFSEPTDKLLEEALLLGPDYSSYRKNLTKIAMKYIIHVLKENKEALNEDVQKYLLWAVQLYLKITENRFLSELNSETYIRQNESVMSSLEELTNKLVDVKDVCLDLTNYNHFYLFSNSQLLTLEKVEDSKTDMLYKGDYKNLEFHNCRRIFGIGFYQDENPDLRKLISTCSLIAELRLSLSCIYYRNVISEDGILLELSHALNRIISLIGKICGSDSMRNDVFQPFDEMNFINEVNSIKSSIYRANEYYKYHNNNILQNL